MIYFGDVKPEGWIKKELEKAMDGCIGHLDELLPDMLVEHKIYGRDRIGADSGTDGLNKKWWDSESQSNWQDGFCRSALLLQDQKWLKKAGRYVEEILNTQDDDGYMGIYTSELRFQHESENGELWAQSTLFRVLLGYYEATKEENVFQAVRKAAERVMSGYPKDSSRPFCVEKSGSGHCHGVTISESFFRLYQLTGEKKYAEYALWLYEDFSSWPLGEGTLKSGNIADTFYRFYDHGVHTYEQIRTVIIAAEQKEDYKKLLDLLFVRLPYFQTPSGGPVGDEYILGRTADASATGYEYCSVHELMHSYLFFMERTGNLRWGDKGEWLFYNAGFGMRHPKESSITYCMTDNCYTADERKHPDTTEINKSYKFSPTHKDSAVCCVPNAGRIIPYFVQSAFVECEEGYKVGVYMPCRFSGTYKGIGVEINERTDYPFDFNIELEICTESPVEMSISLRFPGWAVEMEVNNQVYRHDDVPSGEVKIRKLWSKTEKIRIKMKAELQFQTDFRQDYYISYGPILYAVPLEAEEKLLKKLDVEPFEEKGYTPVDRKWENLGIAREDRKTFYMAGQKKPKSFHELRVRGTFRLEGKAIEKEMVPLAETILRKVTFERVRNC